MGNIKLYNEQQQEIDLGSLGLLGLKLSIPSPSYARETEIMDGMPGVIVVDKKLNPRILTAEFWSKSQNYEDSLRSRDELYGLIGNGKPFYVSESKNPGKRYKFYADGWEPERVNTRITSFSVPLFVPTGTAESVQLVQRKFTEPNFSFKNEGVEPINMRWQSETEIEFKGASTGLTITNKTTGDQWKYDGSTTANDTVLLKGVRSTKNGQSIFGKTNKKLIGFAPGWNEIEVTGANDFILEIRTRFYFL